MEDKVKVSLWSLMRTPDNMCYDYCVVVHVHVQHNMGYFSTCT